MLDINHLQQIAKLIRYYILTSTSKAGSGHPSSSLSAVELMTLLMFAGYFHANLDNPDYHNNDRLIFSKGHASPLLYSLYTVMGKILPDELMTLRQFNSPYEGHPTRAFPYTEIPTGSLGQGLSVGIGLAINAKYLDHLTYKTYVLLGDSEMSEGSNYEAMQLATFYQLDNLIAIVDVNRLGQRGPTIVGHDLDIYAERFQSFGWQTEVVDDGHDFDKLNNAFSKLNQPNGQPLAIIAKTLKGKGVDFLEDQLEWHGKVLNSQQLESALNLLGVVDTNLNAYPATPTDQQMAHLNPALVSPPLEYQVGQLISPRQAYGDGLMDIASQSQVVVIDAEVSNSTFAKTFANHYPKQFFEMFIAEQNMVGTALGLSRRHKKPYISTFGAFYSRAADQLRMSGYSHTPLVCAGTHAGISIGADGSSQMALEDISLFRSIYNSQVLYPADAQSARQLVHQSLNCNSITYLRLTRNDLPVIYGPDEQFPIGKSKVLVQSPEDQVTIIAAGITVHEALKAANHLNNLNFHVCVIDLYSIKPLDQDALKWALSRTTKFVVVEDHYPQGGIGEAVLSSLCTFNTHFSFRHLSVNVEPKSGTTEELLAYAQINSQAIISTVQDLLS